MVEVGFELVVLIGLLIFAIGLQIETRFYGKNLGNSLLDYDDAISDMQNSLLIIGEVLNKLPDLVPQFQINENPLSQILEFFKQRANQQDSLVPDQFRDPTGQYSDGTTQEEKINPPEI